MILQMQNMETNDKLCDTDTENLIIHEKSWDVYEELAENVETRFGTSNYEVKRPSPIARNKNLISLMKYQLGGKLMKKNCILVTQDVQLPHQWNSYWQESKGHIEVRNEIQDYRGFLKNNKTPLKYQ